MTNHAAGHQAEEKAAEYLRAHHFKILDLNWRTRSCEIDIVAVKKDVVYFVEVKYRSTSRQGSGFDYITPKKLKQMAFAAEMWVSQNRYTGSYQLAALSIDGETVRFIDSVS